MLGRTRPSFQRENVRFSRQFVIALLIKIIIILIIIIQNFFVNLLINKVDIYIEKKFSMFHSVSIFLNIVNNK